MVRGIGRAVAAGRTIHPESESFSIPGITIKRGGGLALALQPLPLPQLKPLIHHSPSQPTTQLPLLHPIIAADILAATDPPPVCVPTATFVTTALPHQHRQTPSVTHLTTPTTTTPTALRIITTTGTIAAALARAQHRATIEVILRDTTTGAPHRPQAFHIAIPIIRAQGHQDLRNHHKPAWLRGVRTHRTPNPIAAAGPIRMIPNTVLTRAK